MDQPPTIDVPVEGGTLKVGIWGPPDAEAPTVLAVHGVSSSHLIFSYLARELPDLRIVAPDLRGRGGSAALPGPWGMARHSDDLLHVLDTVGVEEVLAVGHSMGGYVCTVLRHRAPERVRDLLLVDGGVPLPVPADVPMQDVIEAVIGPVIARLSRTFPSREAYHDFVRNPAFAGDWTDVVEAYVDYDLTGTPPHLRSRARLEAVQYDSIDFLQGGALREAIAEMAAQPATLVRAPLGLRDEPPGLLPEALLAARAGDLPGLKWRTIDGVNHYTILMSERGAKEVARDVRALTGTEKAEPD